MLALARIVQWRIQLSVQLECSVRLIEMVILKGLTAIQLIAGITLMTLKRAGSEGLVPQLSKYVQVGEIHENDYGYSF